MTKNECKAKLVLLNWKIQPSLTKGDKRKFLKLNNLEIMFFAESNLVYMFSQGDKKSTYTYTEIINWTILYDG